ncbi:MAG: hypothetical protein ACYS8Y_08575 [Planctomycetota bacterium]|jgi:hypothetical protein
MTTDYIEWQLGISSSDEVRLFPNQDGYRDKRAKLFSGVRAQTGKHYKYTFGHYSRDEFDCEYIVESTALLVNSWWESDTELLLFKITEVESIVANTAANSSCTDPDYEVDTPGDWKIYQSSLFSQAYSGGGSYFLECYLPTSLGGSAAIYSQSIMDGRKYFFSGDFACDSQATHKITLDIDGNSFYTISEWASGQGSDAFETYSYEFTANETNGNLRIVLSAQTSGYSAYADNIIFGLVHQTEVTSVMIQNKEKPFGEFSAPYVNKYKGKVILETY